MLSTHGRHQRTAGFTLVEVIIVVVVISILAGLVIVSYTKLRESAAVSSLKKDLANAADTVEMDRTNSRMAAYPRAFMSGLEVGQDVTVALTETASNQFCINGVNRKFPHAIFRYDSLNGISEGLCDGEVIASSVTVGGGAFSQLETGYGHTCGIYNKQAYCWGRNDFGQLGDGTNTNSLVPVAVDTSGALSGLKMSYVDAGSDGGCAVATNGRAYCWGYAYTGRLGNGSTSTTSAFSPVPVNHLGVLSGKAVTKIDTTSTHTCAVASGRAYCWGQGTPTGSGATTTQSNPVAVSTSGVLSGKRVTSIQAGSAFTCAIADSLPYCWGYAGGSGYLGEGTIGTSITSPVAVSTSGPLQGRKLLSISSAGSTCVQAYSGSAACWGLNNYGQLGTGNTTSSPVPVSVIISGMIEE